MKFVLLIVFIPALLFSTTIQEIYQQLDVYQKRIQSLQAEFLIEIHGTKRTASVQKGVFTYLDYYGTMLQYNEPVKMTIELRNNGDIVFNGKKQQTMTNSYQMGDIYFLYYLNNYSLKIDKEDTGIVYISGYEKSDVKKVNVKRILKLRFDKGLHVIDKIQYIGNENDFPYEILAGYLVIQGIPVMQRLDMNISAYSVSVNSVFRLSNINLIMKQ